MRPSGLWIAVGAALSIAGLTGCQHIQWDRAAYGNPAEVTVVVLPFENEAPVLHIGHRLADQLAEYLAGRLTCRVLGPTALANQLMASDTVVTTAPELTLSPQQAAAAFRGQGRVICVRGTVIVYTHRPYLFRTGARGWIHYPYEGGPDWNHPGENHIAVGGFVATRTWLVRAPESRPVNPPSSEVWTRAFRGGDAGHLPVAQVMNEASDRMVVALTRRSLSTLPPWLVVPKAPR